MENQILIAQERSFNLLGYLLKQNKRFEKEFGKKEQNIIKNKYKNPVSFSKTKKNEISNLTRSFNDMIKATEYLINEQFLVDLSIPVTKVALNKTNMKELSDT